MVAGLCRGLLRDPTDCEDASQQTFLSAYRALLGGVEPREPAAWLATIARNECLARIRERMRRPLPVAEVDVDVSALPDAHSEAIRRADLAALRTAISALPRQQRDALLMREFAGLRYDELAVALGVSEPSVESLLFRARSRLRAALQPVYGLVSVPLAVRDLLARFAGAGAAAKLGTATVGAAVVAGGAAVVAPQIEQRRHRPVPPAPVAAPAASSAHADAEAPPPQSIAAVRVAPVVAPSSDEQQHGEASDRGPDQREQGEAHQVQNAAGDGEHRDERADGGDAGQDGESGHAGNGDPGLSGPSARSLPLTGDA